MGPEEAATAKATTEEVLKEFEDWEDEVKVLIEVGPWTLGAFAGFVCSRALSSSWRSLADGPFRRWMHCRRIRRGKLS